MFSTFCAGTLIYSCCIHVWIQPGKKAPGRSPDRAQRNPGGDGSFPGFHYVSSGLHVEVFIDDGQVLAANLLPVKAVYNRLPSGAAKALVERCVLKQVPDLF